MKILVYPKDKNPYQELLYSQLRSKIEIKYLERPMRSHTLGLFLFFPMIFYYRIKGFTIFHLHWVDPFISPFKNWLFNNLLTKAFYTLYFIFFIFFIKILQYRLVWTVHNIIEHEKHFIDDIWISKFLAKMSDLDIVHSKTTIDEMEKMGFDVSKCKIIPIGNYMDIYPNSITKTEARNILNLSKEDFVFLSFGIIKEYKGIDDLLIEFSKLVNIYKENKIKLIIAGECNNIRLRKLIEKYQISLKDSLICELEHIADKDVQIFFNACDIAVYPFKRITTSSTVILALSLIKPIICPRMGALKELPDDIGFFYDPEDKKGLSNYLEKAFTNKDNLEVMGKNVLRYVKNLSWDKIAEKTYNIYKNIESKSQ